MPRPLHELCFLAAAVSIGTVHAQAQTIADLGILLAAWDTDSDLADLSGNGIVNGADLGLLLADWTD